MARTKIAEVETVTTETTDVINPQQQVYGYLVGTITRQVEGALVSREIEEDEDGNTLVVTKHLVETITEDSETPWMMPCAGGKETQLVIPYFLKDSMTVPAGFTARFTTEPQRKRKSKKDLGVILAQQEAEEDYGDL